MDFKEIIEELQNQIFEKNINFLFGSGASVPYFKSLGNVEKILTYRGLDNTLRQLIYLNYYNKCIRKNEVLLNEVKECEFSITINYINFIQNLAGRMNYRNDRISPKRANIFTTNYDVFFEKAINIVQQRNPSLILNDGGHGYFNRFLSAENYHKTVSRNGVFDNYHKELLSLNLIKCHGSVTWEKSKGKIEDRLEIKSNLELLEDVTEAANQVNMTTEEKAMIDAFLMNDSFVQELGDRILDHFLDRADVLERFMDEYNKLTIVNPEKTKFGSTVMEEYYYSTLRLLSYELEREQSILVIFGFSFADEHIRNLIKRSVHNPSLRIYIFAYSFDAAFGIKSLLNSSSQKNIVILGPDEGMKFIDFKQFNRLLFGAV